MLEQRYEKVEPAVRESAVMTMNRSADLISSNRLRL